MPAVFDWIKISSLPKSKIAALRIGDFSHVRLYHLCRPIDIESYRERGIRLVPYEELCEQFRNLVSDCDAAVVQQVTSSYRPNHGDRRVDFGLDYRHLLECANHYCVYGSEFVAGLCVDLQHALGAVEDFRQRMKKRGRPTVLAVDVPLVALRAEERESVEDELQTLQLGHPEEYDQPGNICHAAISVYENIPADWITHAFHPDTLVDVLTREKYRWELR